ncbi:heparin lyase I family protein [Ectothiorhodospiraceae bacterium 2226]|nr:heparin lyase I family protein [Ectothiorhodospiraceae bacterium 2226]
MMLGASQVHAQLLYKTDFESLEPEWRHHGNTTTRIKPSPDGYGKAAYFEIEHGDSSNGSLYRSEIVFISDEVHPEVRNAEIGKEYWYGFSIWLDEHEPDVRGENWFQWGRTPDRDAAGNLLEIYGNPPLSLGSTDDGRWVVLSMSDKRKYSTDKTFTTWNRFVVGEQELGRWHHFVFNVKWAYDEGQGGLLRIWKDGKLKVDHRGPNAYNDDRGPKITMGIYKFSWRQDQSTNVDRIASYAGAVRIADHRGSFDMVSTIPVHTPPSRVVEPHAPRDLRVSVSDD